MSRKYELSRPERIKHPLRNAYIVAYRIVALRDIPRHGVKAGDIGGYVDSRKTLSQEGECWIGDDAIVVDKSIVKHDAVVKGNAVVSGTRVYHNAAIYGNARVSEIPGLKKAMVTNSAQVYGEAQVVSSSIDGYSRIHEAALVNQAIVEGYSEIYGYAKIVGPGVKIADSEIYGYAEIHNAASVEGSIIHCQVEIHNSAKVEDAILVGARYVKEKDYLYSKRFKDGCRIDGKAIQNCAGLYVEKAVASFTAPKETTGPSERKRLDDIEHKYAEYEKDIVKIIKYPVMTDLTDPYTAKFASAMRKAQRLFGEGNMPAYREALDTLEDAFHVAESHARKISLSRLVPDERNKVADARQMLAIALDDAASDTEKKNAYKGAMRNLEGIVAVPEAALSSLRQRIGLLEIEA